MAERDDFTHLIWDNDENFDNLIMEIGLLIMDTNFRNNIRYPENVTAKDKNYQKLVLTQSCIEFRILSLKSTNGIRISALRI